MFMCDNSEAEQQLKDYFSFLATFCLLSVFQLHFDNLNEINILGLRALHMSCKSKYIIRSNFELIL